MTTFTPQRKCECCSKLFTPAQKHQRYCSVQCRDTQYRTSRQASELSTLPKGTVGAMSELLASADLMRRGYEVFRALSPHTSCDLLTLKDGVMLRIEVRTGHLMLGGKMTFPHNGTGTKRGEDALDHYAVVLYPVEAPPRVVYEPPLSDTP